MSEQIEFQLNLRGGKKAVNSISELEKRLEKARQKIKEVEIGSKAFNKLANEIQKASSEVKTLDKMMEGLEPQQKAEAFLKMGEGIVGAFTVATGAMAIFGSESETLQEIQTRVQGAIAIAMGARMIAEGALQGRVIMRTISESAATKGTIANTIATYASALATKILGKAVLTTSRTFKIMKAALISTGIGALVVGVGMLVESLVSYFDTTEDTTEAEKRRAKAVEELTKRQEELKKIQRENITSQMNANKIQEIGAKKGFESAEYKIALLNENIRTQEKHVDLLISERSTQTEINKARVWLESLIKKRIEQEARLQRAIERRNQKSTDAINIYTLENELSLLRLSDEDEINKEKLRQDKEIALKKIENAYNFEEQKILIDEKYIKLEKERIQEKEDRETDDLTKFLKDLQAIYDEFNNTETQSALDAVENKYAELYIRAEEFGYDIAELKQQEQDEITKIEEDAAAVRAEIAFGELQNKRQFTADMISAVAGLDDSNKDLARASILYNTYVGAMAVFGDKTIIGWSKFAAYAAVIATGLKSLQVVNSSSIGSVSATPAPLDSPQLSGSFSLGETQQEPIQAYVVTDDMTNSQDKLANIRRRASI